jgi:predicted kinase
MSKVLPNKPLFIMLYGYPGAGKSHFARELSHTLQAAHVHADRIRGELFTKPRYDKEENSIVDHLMLYMAEEFLQAGVSVIFDANVDKLAQRRSLRNLIRHTKAQVLMVWLQIDAESAYLRLNKRDRRKTDDKYARSYSRDQFDAVLAGMQNPKEEDYIVISGKHTFNTQRSAIFKKLYELGLVTTGTTTSNVVKPELVNLVPNPLAGRVDQARRNIVIR